MSDRIVSWQAVADFSAVRKEAKDTQASLAALQAQTDAMGGSNNKLGASETSLASDISKSSNTQKSALADVAAARTKATQAAVDSNAVSAQSLAASQREENAARALIKAQDDAKTAATNVSNAETKLSQARAKTESATNAASVASKNYEDTLSKGTATAQQVEAAETKLGKARAAVTKASDDEANAEGALNKAKDISASKTTAASTAEGKLQQAYARSTQQVKAINDAEEARAAQQAKSAANEEALIDRAISKNTSLKSSLQDVTAARTAAKNATLLDSSAEDDNTSRVTRGAAAAMAASAAKKESSTLTAAEQTATTRLSTSINTLNAARQKEVVSTNTVNSNIQKLAVAEALETTAKSRLSDVTADYDKVMNSSSASTLDMISADSRLTEAQNDVESAGKDVDDAETKLASSRARLSAVTQQVEADTVRLESSVRNLDSTLAASGDDGNKLTGVLSAVSGAFDDGATSAVMTLGKFVGLGGGILVLVEGLSSLVSALFAVVSASSTAAGTLAALGPIALTVGAAIGSIKLAFSGVGSVLKDYSAAQTAATTDSTKNADTQISNAEAIQNAQLSLRDAQEAVGTTAQSVSDANAKADYTEQQAQYSLTQSQIALTAARQAAITNIEALKQAVIDASLAEQGASLTLQQAQLTLTQTLNDPTATKLQIQQAQLAVANAQNSAAESVTASKAAATASTTASKLGVNNSTSVVAAKKAEEDATYNLQQAQLSYTETVQSGAVQNRNAQEAVAKAIQSLADAQRNANDNTSSAATAAETYKAALDKLSPSAQAFVKQLISMESYTTKLKAAAANGLFPGLTAGLKDLTGSLFPILLTMISGVSQALGTIAEDAGKDLGSASWDKLLKTLSTAMPSIIIPFGKAILAVAKAFLNISVAAIPLAKNVATATKNIADHFETITNGQSAYDRMTAYFSKAWTTLKLLGDITKNFGLALFNTGKASADSGRSMLTDIDNVYKKWLAWTESVQGNKTMHKFFAEVETDARATMGLLGDISKAFLSAGTSKTLVPIIDAIEKDLIPAIQNLFKQLGGSGGNIGVSIVKMLTTVVNVITAISQHGSTFKLFVGTITGFVSALGAVVKIPGVAPVLGAIAAALGAIAAVRFIGAITGLGKVADGLKSVIKLRGEANLAMDSGKKLSVGQKVLSTGHTAAAPSAASTILNGGGEVAGTEAAVGGTELAESAAPEAAEGASMLGPIGILVAGIAVALGVAYLKVKWFHDGVNDAFKDVGKAVSSVWKNDLKPAFESIAKYFSDHSGGFSKLWTALGKEFAALGPIFDKIAPLLKFDVAVLGAEIKVTADIFVVAIDIIIETLNLLAYTIAWVINNVVIPTIKVVEGAIVILYNLIKLEFNLMKTLIETVWNSIKLFLVTLWNSIKIIADTAFKVIGDIITGHWSQAWTDIESGWDKLWSTLTKAWDSAEGIAGKAFTNIASAIVTAFSGIGDGLSIIWNGVENDFAAAINFVSGKLIDPLIDAINAVLKPLTGVSIPRINAIDVSAPGMSPSLEAAAKASIPMFSAAQGGVLPGYTPGRDVHQFYSPTGGRLNLSGGEGILVPEAVRAIGGARGLQAINSQASAGRVPGGSGSFAGGGVFGIGQDLLGGAKNLLTSGVDVLRDVTAWATKEGLEAAVAPLRALISTIPSQFLQGLSTAAINDLIGAAYAAISGNKTKASDTPVGTQNTIGLDSTQMTNAADINAAGSSMKATARDVEIAFMTALTESGMRNLANPNVPASMTLPHDGTGTNLDSVGMFQQRNSWGSAAQRLDPTETSKLFFNRELNVAGRNTLPMGVVAQDVQVSEFPDRYNAYQAQAMKIYSQLTSKANVSAGQAFANGGQIQAFHTGGIVGGMAPGHTQTANAALGMQTLTEFPTNGVWTSKMTAQIKKRLSGVDAANDVTNTMDAPRAFADMNPNDKRIPDYIGWLQHFQPKGYKAASNFFGGNPYTGMQAYMSNPAAFQKHKWPKGYNPTGMLQDQIRSYYGWTDDYRSKLGTPGSGAWSPDMDAPSDHVTAHGLGQAHPADWPHPWSGPVTVVEQQIAQQDRANSLNTEWYNDLQILADWGFSDLVDSLLTQGISDGLSIAQSAITNKTLAGQLNASIQAGNDSLNGVSSGDQATILKSIAIIASGSATANKGLRDVSGTLQVPDYAIVNLYSDMTSQLSALPNDITAKFNSDVNLFREGLFYANSGAIVPGVGNKDTVHAVLTPGEGVLNTMAMRMLGHDTFNAMNNGNVQAFATGGVVLSPNITSPSLGSSASGAMASAHVNGERGGNTYITELNTTIQGTTGNSVYEMNKMLQTKSATGQFNRAAKVGD